MWVRVATYLVAHLFLVPPLFSVETAPLDLLRVVDGDTITVAGSLGEVELSVKVRLIGIDCPESYSNKHGKAMQEGKQATQALEDYLKGSQVTLWFPSDAIETDKYGRVLAIVKPVDPEQKNLVSAQQHLIRLGLAPYWRKYGDLKEPYHTSFLEAQEEAKQAQKGLWSSNPQWITDKANQRTRPKENE